ncbi:MAG: FG-GAP repeat domain-containing protein, partial [Planctomycetota bacterium]
LVVADLDGDGDQDLAFCEPGGFGVPGTIWVFAGDGKGGFTQAAALSHPGPAALAVADANGDGRPDLAVTSAVTSFATKPTPTLSFLFKGAGWTFASGDPQGVVVGNTPVTVVASDLDGDGRADFVVGCPGDGTLHVLIGR